MLFILFVDQFAFVQVTERHLFLRFLTYAFFLLIVCSASRPTLGVILLTHFNILFKVC